MTKKYVAADNPSTLTTGCQRGTLPLANLGSIDVGAVKGNKLKIVAMSPFGA